MKGKTYYTGTSYAHRPPFAPNHPSHRPWKDDTQAPVRLIQILYMWKTSVPHHWKSITARPMQQVKGLYNAKRDTLEFLRETQQYIDSIRKSTMNSTRKGEQRTISPRQKSGSPRVRPVGTQAGSREERFTLEEGKSHVGGLMSSRLSRTETLETPAFSAREPLPTQLQRVLTLPSSLIEAGFGPTADPSPQEEYLIHSYLPPHSLVPLPKRTPKSRQLQRLCAADVQTFLSRFDRKREAEVAPVARKGMPGWKLKLGTKGTRPRTEMMGSRPEMSLEGKQI